VIDVLVILDTVALVGINFVPVQRAPVQVQVAAD